MLSHAVTQEETYKPHRDIHPEYTNVAARGPLLDRVYSMRYRSYRTENYISENRSKKFMDEYDAMPNCTSYLMYSKEKTVASIRSCIYDPKHKLPVPAMEIFEDEIRETVGYEKAFVEVNKFVVEPEFQNSGGRSARFSLFCSVVKETFDSGAENVIIAVRPAHVRFYRMFSCTPISEIKTYPHLNFKTVLLACTDVERAKSLIISQAQRHLVTKNESVSRHCAC